MDFQADRSFTTSDDAPRSYGLGEASIFDENDPSYGTDPLLGDIRPCAIARRDRQGAATTPVRRRMT